MDETPTIDQLLHDADRAVMGARMAAQMRDVNAAMAMARNAERLYRQALKADPTQTDPAWYEVGNRDAQWLAERGLAVPVEA